MHEPETNIEQSAYFWIFRSKKAFAFALRRETYNQSDINKNDFLYGLIEKKLSLWLISGFEKVLDNEALEQTNTGNLL